MSRWLGKEDPTGNAGMPHVSYVPRKPEPTGAELKSICDAESGVMLRVDLQVLYVGVVHAMIYMYMYVSGYDTCGMYGAVCINF